MTTHTADGPGTMPPYPVRPTPLRLAASADGPHGIRLHLHGDLDYDNAEQLLDAVREQLADHPGLRRLELNCAELITVDSMGLSTLLTAHRLAAAAGAHLHLEDRTRALDRLLQITGTLDHFTARAPERIPGRADRT